MCPACGSDKCVSSPKTGMLCLTCECNFDPAHARRPGGAAPLKLNAGPYRP
jgi:hypothetical protein